MLVMIKNAKQLQELVITQPVTRASRLLIYKLQFQNIQSLFVLMPQTGVHTLLEYSTTAKSLLTMQFWLLVILLTEHGSLRIHGEQIGD